jgi:hypothetical protein
MTRSFTRLALALNDDGDTLHCEKKKKKKKSRLDRFLMEECRCRICTIRIGSHSYVSLSLSLFLFLSLSFSFSNTCNKLPDDDIIAFVSRKK